MEEPTLDDIAERVTFNQERDYNYTSTGKISGYKCRVHFKLDSFEEVKTLTAREEDDLRSKVDKLGAKFNTEANKIFAKEFTEFLEFKISEWQLVLHHTLEIDDALDWEQMQVKESYATPAPKKPRKQEAPNAPEEKKFLKPISFFQKLFGQSEKITARQQESYKNALRLWENERDKIEKEHAIKLQNYQLKVEEWEKAKVEFETKQREVNKSLSEFRASYKQGSPEFVERYIGEVLANSNYPDEYEPESEISYNPITKVLVLGFQLPSIDELPKYESRKYVAASQELVDKEISEAKLTKLHESVMYQVALRTVHEIFESDVEHHIEAVVFNGYLQATDKKTGMKNNACIMSVSTAREQFEAINLDAVDPKECFKGLKGVGAPKLSSQTPIKPIANVDRADRRFVDSRSVTEGLDHSINLASMDWEDFEHLVRELFEQEFGAGGTEVKVTQASSDGGVDAIAIDPDPIRGGKIVIQAKRYTNVVGVSAVRDLWGTVQHEGAMKGILVTTSDFGPDSFEFVKDKPISLINGGNLLYLLEKHGHEAKIDIQAARSERLS